MATTPTTVASLIEQVRLRTDTVNSLFITDPEILSYLNSALGELDDVLVTTYEDFKLITADLTLAASDPVAGNNFLTIPDDLYKLRGVDYLVGGRWATVQPFQLSQRNTFAYPLSMLPYYGYLSIYYRLSGDKIYIIPGGTATGQYRLWYVPMFEPLADSDDLPSYMDSQSWCEFAINDVCARILQKQDLDPSVFLANKAAQQMRIVNAASGRDAGPPRRMVNTRAMHDGDDGSTGKRWGWG